MNPEEWNPLTPEEALERPDAEPRYPRGLKPGEIEAVRDHLQAEAAKPAVTESDQAVGEAQRIMDATKRIDENRKEIDRIEANMRESFKQGHLDQQGFIQLIKLQQELFEAQIILNPSDSDTAMDAAFLAGIVEHQNPSELAQVSMGLVAESMKEYHVASGRNEIDEALERTIDIQMYGALAQRYTEMAKNNPQQSTS